MARPQGGRLPKRLSQRSAQRILEADGWAKTRGGKHSVKMEKSGQRPITLPMHGGADYGPDLTAAIYKQAGLRP